MPSQYIPVKPGTKIDRYVIEEKIGRGGVGTVYKCMHVLLGNAYAIKIYDYAIEGKSFEAQFFQSARYLAHLDHKNIVKIHECGIYLGRPYVVMEYVGRNTLGDIIPNSEKENWSTRASEWTNTAILIFADLLSAINYAHNAIYTDFKGENKKCILHGDIKPGNIILDDESKNIKVTDFFTPDVKEYMLSRPERSVLCNDYFAEDDCTKVFDETVYLNEDHKTTIARLAEEFRGNMCMTSCLGTPGYMSKEQKQGIISVRSDIHSLGCTLFEMLTGYHPTLLPDMANPKQINPHIPQWVELMLFKSTCENPRLCYCSVSEMESYFLENINCRSNNSGGALMSNTYNITLGDGSSISGQIYVGRFNDVVTQLNNSGMADIAGALLSLQQLILKSRFVDDTKKEMYTGVLESIGNEAAKDKPNKMLISTLWNGFVRSAEAIPGIASCLSSVAEVIAHFII